MNARNEHERRTAARLFERGETRADVARQVGISRATATRWFRTWERGGLAALVAPSARGRAPKLAGADLAAVHRALAAPPADAGFALERWSLAAVVALIQRTTGVTYHPHHVARVLRRAGWVVPPVGASARHAFRELVRDDPDGNVFHLRRPVG